MTGKQIAEAMNTQMSPEQFNAEEAKAVLSALKEAVAYEPQIKLLVENWVRKGDNNGNEALWALLALGIATGYRIGLSELAPKTARLD